MQRPTLACGKLPARDLERVWRFYTGALGVHPFAERDGHLYYDIGGCRFMIYTSAGSSGAHDQLGFVTADLAGHIAQMRGRGVVFEDFPGTGDGIADFGPVRAAWFRDSEGSLINPDRGQLTPLVALTSSPPRTLSRGAGRGRFRLRDQVRRWLRRFRVDHRAGPRRVVAAAGGVVRAGSGAGPAAAAGRLRSNAGSARVTAGGFVAQTAHRLPSSVSFPRGEAGASGSGLCLPAVPLWLWGAGLVFRA
jgi:hypothetical protein